MGLSRPRRILPSLLTIELNVTYTPYIFCSRNGRGREFHPSCLCIPRSVERLLQWQCYRSVSPSDFTECQRIDIISLFHIAVSSNRCAPSSKCREREDSANPHSHLTGLNSIRYGVKGVSGKETQQGYPDSDREMQQSKCCALPFGDSPMGGGETICRRLCKIVSPDFWTISPYLQC